MARWLIRKKLWWTASVLFVLLSLTNMLSAQAYEATVQFTNNLRVAVFQKVDKITDPANLYSYLTSYAKLFPVAGYVGPNQTVGGKNVAVPSNIYCRGKPSCMTTVVYTYQIPDHSRICWMSLTFDYTHYGAPKLGINPSYFGCIHYPVDSPLPDAPYIHMIRTEITNTNAASVVKLELNNLRQD